LKYITSEASFLFLEPQKKTRVLFLGGFSQPSKQKSYFGFSAPILGFLGHFHGISDLRTAFAYGGWVALGQMIQFGDGWGFHGEAKDWWIGGF
jgi:hypothetical protein